MATFRDRLRAVIGDVPFSRWAKDRGIQPSTVEEWLEKGRTPRPASIRNLAEKTGISEVWWLKGEGEPPANGLKVCASCNASVAEEERAPYLVNPVGIDAALLQQVIDVFYAWLDGNADRVRIDRSRHGAVIAVLYRIALQAGKARKDELEQVLELAA